MSHPPRRVKRTLNIVVALYVVIGFCVAVPAAFSGNRLNAFLGFLIISGALAAAAVIAPVLRIAARMAAIDDHLRDVRSRLRRIETAAEVRRAAEREDSTTTVVNLARVGRGDPGQLAAATLERDVFPRLVTTMEEAPPADGALVSPAEDAGGLEPRAASAGEGKTGVAEAASAASPAPVTSISLLSQWKMGMRDGDLFACRNVYSALVDTVDSGTLSSLKEQLELLADRTEASLRKRFAACLRDRDVDGMTRVGEEIVHTLPDRPIAEEFRRIRPLLLGSLRLREDDPAERFALFAGTPAGLDSIPDKRAGS